MKNNKQTKCYSSLGKVLCGIAGGIVGFVTGGIGFAILGIIPGFFIGHILQKSFVG